MDVIAYAEKRLEAFYSMHNYMKDTLKWDETVKRIMALKGKDKYYLQVAGRLDIAANDIYGNAMFDWVLLIYNGIRRIGDFGDATLRKTLHMTLTALESQTVELPLQHSTIVVLDLVGNVIPTFLDIQNRTYADVIGTGVSNDLLITYTDSGALIQNVSAINELRFVIAYEEGSNDNYLDVGTEIIYPDKDEMLAALRQGREEENKKTEGFARL